MDMNQAALQPPAGLPPTVPGQMRRPRTSVWPSAVGIVCIVIGALGLLQYGCAGTLAPVVGHLVMTSLQDAGIDDPGSTASFQAQQRYMVPTLISSIVHAGLSGLLMTTGIGMSRRRRWSIRAARTWSVLRMLMAFPAIGLQYLVMQEQFRAMETTMQQSAQPMPGFFMPMMHSMGIVMMPVGLMFAWALPLFILIWLHIARVRGEWSTWT
jgi:hypothetical protein